MLLGREKKPGLYFHGFLSPAILDSDWASVRFSTAFYTRQFGNL
jgi:hypothetical protein